MIADDSLKCLMEMNSSLATVMERQNNFKESFDDFKKEIKENFARLEENFESKIALLNSKIGEMDKKMKPITLKDFLFNYWGKILTFNFMVIVLVATGIEYYYHDAASRNHQPIALEVLKHLR